MAHRYGRLTGVLVASALALAVSPVGSAGAVEGSDGVEPRDELYPRSGNGGYDVRSYDLRLRYRPATNVLRARALVRATVTQGQALRSFNLDYRGPAIKRLKVNGAPASYERQGQELIITPDEPVADGAPLHVYVRYAGKPKQLRGEDGSREGWIRTSDGAVALGEPRGSPTWFPANDHPSDKASYRIAVTTPRPTLGISNGRLVRSKRSKRGVTTVWRESGPMASYLATVAIGRFRIDRGRVAGIPYLAAVDRDLAPRHLRTLRLRTRRAHQLMRDVAGPYPFAATGGTIDPSSVGYALETQGRPYYPGPPSQDLVVHEIAHEWYGNSVSPRRWNQIWLNEGFATYMEWLYAERRGGMSAQRRFNRLYEDHPESNGGFWNPPPAAVDDAAEMFATSVYVRGAMALQVLRAEIDNEDFFEVLREWAVDNAGGDANTDELRGLIEKVTGEPVPDSFEEWLMDEGKPDKPAAP